MSIVNILICLVIGYAFGLIQSGYVFVKLIYKKDVRDYGSHNAGTTNTLRVFGKLAGYIVFFADALKVVAAVVIVRYFVFACNQDLKVLEMITGFGVVLGHNFPFYMGFKGGKGVAATGGLMFALDWRMALIAAIVFGLVFYTTRYVSVGSLVITALFPVMLAFFYPGQWTLAAIGVVFTAMAWWRHKANIQRLLAGTENKFEKKTK